MRIKWNWRGVALCCFSRASLKHSRVHLDETTNVKAIALSTVLGESRLHPATCEGCAALPLRFALELQCLQNSFSLPG